MNKKAVLSIGLLTVVSASLLCGCGSSSSTPSTTTIQSNSTQTNIPQVSTPQVQPSQGTSDQSLSTLSQNSAPANIDKTVSDLDTAISGLDDNTDLNLNADN